MEGYVPPVEEEEPEHVEAEEEDDDESEEEEDDDEDEEEDEDDDEEDEVGIVNPPARVLAIAATASGPECGQKRQRGGATSFASGGNASASADGWNREEMEGLCCPICLEAWSNGGEHYPSCLPCGHLYGMSCIKKWLKCCRRRGKCPQCNTKCLLTDIRRIYGSKVIVKDDESQQRIRFLECKCSDLEKKDAEWRRKEAAWEKKEAEWLKKEADLFMQLHRLKERTKNIGPCPQVDLMRQSAASGGSQEWQTGYNWGSTCRSTVTPRGFVLQKEFQMNGARFIDIDAAGQMLIIARSLTGVGGTPALTKMSLLYPHDQEDIYLPLKVKAVKDLHVSPYSRQVLMASLGSKLSIMSLENNNVILDYDLPAPAWSCSWDIKSPHIVYAGMQTGIVLVFDTRQTDKPLESLSGLTHNPVHTIYSIQDNYATPSSTGTLLTASSVGVCQWSIGCGQRQPLLVPGTENLGVCVSLAYCSSNDYLVASYRPKHEMLNQFSVSQPPLTPSMISGSSFVQGSHVLFKRVGGGYEKLGAKSANLPSIRLPKSVILGMQNDRSVFASADELVSELVLEELPSFAVTHRFRFSNPVRDMKYDFSLRESQLICLSDGKLQFFSQNISGE